MLKLNNIKKPVGSTHSKKRKGLGMGSGLGKTAGKGHKGQLARSGKGKNTPGFEGGQIPLQRRMPKVGFRSAIKLSQVKVNVSELVKYDGQDLKLIDLIPKNMQADTRVRVSVYGQRAPKAFPKSIEAHKFAPAAKKLLEDNGVSMETIEKKPVALTKFAKKNA